MNPEDYLSMVEGIEGLAELMDRSKGALVSRGWSEEGAEAGAIAMYEGAVASQQ